MVVIAQHCLHVILVNLDNEHEKVGSAVGAGPADLADHDVVLGQSREAQRARLREPRLYI
jgi:hypothetical protein